MFSCSRCSWEIDPYCDCLTQYYSTDPIKYTEQEKKDIVEALLNDPTFLAILEKINNEKI